jgi:Asp-tRNA(Asn)/Glu-tRNA(Gln) amidotransferase C subunit
LLKIASLSYLYIKSPAEQQQLYQSVSTIVGWISQIQSIPGLNDADGIPPTTSILQRHAQLRQRLDVVTEGDDEGRMLQQQQQQQQQSELQEKVATSPRLPVSRVEAVMQNVALRDGGFIVVPKVVDLEDQ